MYTTATRCLIAQLLSPYIKKGKNGKLTQDIMNFNPKCNFLDFYITGRRKKKISQKKKNEIAHIQNVVIEFLEYDGGYKEVNGKPYCAFDFFNKPLLERMDEWMTEEKELTRSMASSYLKTIKTTFRRAQRRKIITKNFNPFRGEERFSIP